MKELVRSQVPLQSPSFKLPFWLFPGSVLCNLYLKFGSQRYTTGLFWFHAVKPHVCFSSRMVQILKRGEMETPLGTWWLQWLQVPHQGQGERKLELSHWEPGGSHSCWRVGGWGQEDSPSDRVCPVCPPCRPWWSCVYQSHFPRRHGAQLLISKMFNSKTNKQKNPITKYAKDTDISLGRIYRWLRSSWKDT